ncbi:ribonuclease HI family protein [Gracilibacillus sp. YIM 98692]|uniref:ribonuclease HI family protein n=1 Tax=Gracilibacillus sp. YIM 98692 TaxID=2663532 RepID=UPI0013D2225F|nr:ribonuclease HI family protein [Gracilibacillus sp. YIM 98692]
MIEVYTDAASQGNPGPSSVGIYIKKDKEKFYQKKYIGTYSNHEAEFIAVLEALNFCRRMFPKEILSFRSDSKTVVEAVEKNYVKNDVFYPYLQQINEQTEYFPYVFFKWIPEKQNKQADKLAREALFDQ